MLTNIKPCLGILTWWLSVVLFLTGCGSDSHSSLKEILYPTSKNATLQIEYDDVLDNPPVIRNLKREYSKNAEVGEQLVPAGKVCITSHYKICMTLEAGKTYQLKLKDLQIKCDTDKVYSDFPPYFTFRLDLVKTKKSFIDSIERTSGKSSHSGYSGSFEDCKSKYSLPHFPVLKYRVHYDGLYFFNSYISSGIQKRVVPKPKDIDVVKLSNDKLDVTPEDDVRVHVSFKNLDKEVSNQSFRISHAVFEQWNFFQNTRSSSTKDVFSANLETFKNRSWMSYAQFSLYGNQNGLLKSKGELPLNENKLSFFQARNDGSTKTFNFIKMGNVYEKIGDRKEISFRTFMVDKIDKNLNGFVCLQYLDEFEKLQMLENVSLPDCKNRVNHELPFAFRLLKGPKYKVRVYTEDRAINSEHDVDLSK